MPQNLWIYDIVNKDEQWQKFVIKTHEDIFAENIHVEYVNVHVKRWTHRDIRGSGIDYYYAEMNGENVHVGLTRIKAKHLEEERHKRIFSQKTITDYFQ